MERKRSSRFRRIFTVDFERLYYVRLGVNVNDCSAGLSHQHGLEILETVL